MIDSDLRDLVCLTMVAGVGPHTSRQLLERFGTAGRVLDASVSTLRDVQGIGPKIADRIATARRDHDAGAELERCRRVGVQVVTSNDPLYPPPLQDIPDPPFLLYIKGSYEPRDPLAIALVGSRRCTPYGLRVAERLGASLARVGITVVSGLARGIDAAAHRGALKAGGRTLGVMANGLGQVYPPEHEDLAAQIADSGAVISEMPMGQGPLAGLFPQRNRIISGLSLGVVVIEATPRSGSLSTAHHAMEQNRDVFAVPGPVDSLSSHGCHRLIRDGARLVETVDDILEELGPLVREIRPSSEETPVRHPAELTLSDLERSLLGQLDDRPTAVDELIGRTGLVASQVLATLSVLEMRRLVRRLPGHQFVRA
ncbi:DNA protecting protein DprA [Singulisphaera acidiphila DSM 18658]|uniref:DNA protecting protein DprA n=2 Tax=Singulisphaera acidiphila TaxID=466153 RepID=L0DP84_SINAD|nr:DNA protecting protein DprA [Singulisphaera acidiphila DSM 18658]